MATSFGQLEFLFSEHLYTMHKVNVDGKKIHQCLHCDYTHIAASLVRSHTLRHHSQLTCSCPVCGKQFRSSKNVQDHILFVHRGRNHPCSFCDYKAQTRDKLKLHIRTIHTHSGYKPYKCPYCDFTCATGGNCRKHVRGKHKDQEVRYIKLAPTTPTDLIMPAIQHRNQHTSVSLGQITTTSGTTDATPASGDMVTTVFTATVDRNRTAATSQSKYH